MVSKNPKGICRCHLIVYSIDNNIGISVGVREKIINQKPITIWLTGLSASGKSTLASELEKILIDLKFLTYVLDGDKVRNGINKDLNFTPEGRSENIRRIAEIANLMNEAGLIVLCALISPFRKDREMAKGIIGSERYFEIHVSTPIETCEQRDPKGLYKLARKSEILEFTGISSPYEIPLNPNMRFDTSNKSPERIANEIVAEIIEIISSDIK